MADIYLSHSSADNAAADQIKSWLERDRPTWSIFLDKHPRDGILAGQRWQDRLRAELQSCRLVMAIISEDWLASRWCFTEAVTATFRGKEFVAVVPSALPDDSFKAAPPIVHERQRKPLDLETGVGWDEILLALDRSGLDPNKWFALPKGVDPYPGFVAFEEKDAGVFFGRNQEITTYLEELNLLKAPDRAQALVISGGSGSGKSSLMKAGLIPRLRQQRDWVIIPPFDPSREPIHALFHALRKAGELAGAVVDLPAMPPGSTEELTEILQNAFRAIEEATSEEATSSWLLLPLDQAEVLVAGSRVDGQIDASQLLDAVTQLLASRARRLVALLTIRTEFLPALERSVPSGMRMKQMPLGPITALSDVIEKPAERFGIELEAGLAGKMVEDTRGGGALPLLAYTLRELNEKHGEHKKLTLEGYADLGGVEGAIEKKLHDALSDPEPTAAEIAALRRTLVRHFVRVDETAVESERYLRQAAQREALPEGAVRLVGRLQEARLLIDGADRTVSIAHERLIKDWRDMPLRRWLAEDSDDRRLIESLRSRLRDHQQGGPLLAEKPLRDAEDLLRRDLALEQEEPDLARFIQDSLRYEREQIEEEKRRHQFELEQAEKLAGTERLRAEEQAQASRRNRKLAHVAGFLALISVAVGGLAFERMVAARNAERVAVQQKSEALAAASRLETDRGDATRGLLLALEALPQTAEDDRPHAPNVEASLVRAIFSLRERRLLRGDGDAINWAVFSPTGAQLLTASRDGTARLWDASSGETLAIFKGHSRQVHQAMFSPDGTRIVTASADHTARIWDSVTGMTIVELKGHAGEVSHASFSPNGRLVLTASDDRTARLWDATTGELLRSLEGHTGPVWSALFSPDGSSVLTASQDQSARIWQLGIGQLEGDLSGDKAPALLKEIRPLAKVLSGHKGPVYSARFAPHGDRIVTASWDKTARLWSAVNGDLLAELKAHQEGIEDAMFSSDGELIATSSADGTALLWSNNGELLATLQHEGQIYEAAFSSDAKRLVTASDDGTAKIWELPTGRLRATLAGHQGAVWQAVFSPDDKQVATASDDGTARIWRTEAIQPAVLQGHRGKVYEAVFSRDGREVATASEDGTARVWDVETGRERTVFEDSQSAAGTQVWGVDFSPDGILLATASTDGVARLWGARTGTKLADLPGHVGWVGHVGFSSDGERIVTAAEDGTGRLWDGKGRLLETLPGHADLIRQADFSPDDRLVVTSSDDKTARLWRAGDGKPVALLEGHEKAVVFAAFSPNSERVATVSMDGTARIWDTATGGHVAVLTGHLGSVWQVEFSPDGSRIVTASWDNTARIWNADDGAPVVTLGGHRGRVADATFSPDGRLVATASWDGTAKIWHAATGQEVATLEGHQGDVRSISFSPDGDRLLTASDDGTARLWQLPVEADDDWVEEARRLAPRSLTVQERREYGLDE